MSAPADPAQARREGAGTVSDMVSVSRDEFEGLRERAEALASEKTRLQQVCDLIDELGRRPGPENALERLARLVRDTIGGSNAVISYRTDHGFVSVDALGETGTTETLDDGTARRAFETGRPVEAAHGSGDVETSTSGSPPALTLAVPLLVGEDIIGILTAEDVPLPAGEAGERLSVFSGCAALVLANEIRSDARLSRERNQLNATAAHLAEEVRQRKKAERELWRFRGQLEAGVLERARAREAASYARGLIEASLDPLAVIDPEGRITDVNRAAEEATGVTRDKLIGTDCCDYFTEPERVREGYERVLSEGRVVDYPLRVRHVSGTVTDVVFNAAVYRDETGKVVGVFAAARDVTESKKAHEQAARLAAIVTSSQDVIFSKDFDETVTSWNAAAEALHGYSAEEMIGTDVEVLTPAGREGEPRRLTERVRRGERISGFETQRNRKDGSVVEVSLTLSPILDDAGDIEAVSVIGHDITERRRSEAELENHKRHLEKLVAERTADLTAANERLTSLNVRLEQLNAELWEATEAKSAFLASMSHELRTPLNSIIGFSSVLGQGLAGPLTDEQRTQLGMINASGRHLLALINDVLDLAKVEAGKTEIHVEPMDAAALVDAVADVVRPLATGRGLELAVDTRNAKGVVHSDVGKIRQILFNLVGNAIKFTDRGRIDMSVRTEPDGECSFAVSDTGCGIRHEDLRRIFQAFTQVDNRQVAKSNGTGLGLKISQEYATLLGGDLRAESEPGVGSVFTLTLPAVTPSPDGPSAA
jgi:PAS domain S-box-containing protein